MSRNAVIIVLLSAEVEGKELYMQLQLNRVESEHFLVQ